MNKKALRAISFLVSVLLVMSSCGKSKEDPDVIVRIVDKRNFSEVEFTYANLTATDKTGRVAYSGDKYNGNNVGVFYHNWHGAHETPGKVLDITEILNENPDYLECDYLDENSNHFHYWGQPLYGYYCSDDPFVITRHIELMMAMGIDFLVYDYTNNSMYDDATKKTFEILQQFYDQGFDVPKITFYTNTNSANVVCQLYNKYYASGKYDHLLYSPNGKPLIIGVSDSSVSKNNVDLYEYLKTEFFDFRESQWPDNKTTIENMKTGFPWMNWCYPQKNYNGMMSVSLSQHPDARMSNGPLTNYGRGFDFSTFRNVTENIELGTNYDGQWKTVFNNNADSTKKYVNQVLVTGFNEWMAQKLNDGQNSFFVDTFSEEYSRDIEMMKGGYDDNYVIQTLTNTRQFKYSEAKHYIYNKTTIDINNFELSQWAKASKYVDPVGDAIERNFRDAFRTTTYIDESARNDIASVYVVHDDENLYVRVDTAEDITAYNGSDVNWMNLLIKTQDGNGGFGGFDYIVNRKPNGNKTSVERSQSGYNWTDSGNAEIVQEGNSIMYKIPLSALGLTADNCYVRIKACDNITKYDDIMDYYVSGDSAPIGRFAYAYGY